MGVVSKFVSRRACNFVPGPNDTWHDDPPGENESTPAKPPAGGIASMTDAPALYFSPGWTCGDGCSFNWARSDFETCAIGVLPSGLQVNLGCVYWGHECSVEHYITEYIDHIMTNTGVTHCLKRNRCDCKLETPIARYPAGNPESIPSVPQRPTSWDPMHDPETQPTIW